MKWKPNHVVAGDITPVGEINGCDGIPLDILSPVLVQSSTTWKHIKSAVEVTDSILSNLTRGTNHDKSEPNRKRSNWYR
jgi:hypothetical protein